MLQVKYYFQYFKLRNCFAVHSFKFIPSQENKQIWFRIRCTFFQKMYLVVVPLTWRMQHQIWSSSNSVLPSRQPFDIIVWVMLVIAHFLTVLPHTGITTIKSIVQAGSSSSSDFNAIT